MIFISICIILIHAQEPCVKSPRLADGTPIPIERTEHGAFVTPFCNVAGLHSAINLKCEDGQLYLTHPNKGIPVLANGINFCIDPENPFPTQSIGPPINRNILPSFWHRIETTHEEANSECPQEASECYFFDDFNYIAGRFKEALEQFAGLELSAKATLDYNLYIDEHVRELKFVGGFHGHVIEFKSGEIYATINTDNEDDFTIFIRPCDKEEGFTCKFIIYREQKLVGDVHMDEDELEDEKQRRNLFSDETEALIEERLKNVQSLHQRRKLKNYETISITFLYDPALQTKSDANAASAEIVLDFNQALHEHKNAAFRLMRKKVVAVKANHFNQDHGSCCGKTSGCKKSGTSDIMKTCRTTASELRNDVRAQIHHCFAHKHSFQSATIGCGSTGKQSVGVTLLGHGHTTNVAIHEIAHQLGADHYQHCWCKTHILWCWEQECTIMKSSVKNTVRKFHPSTIRKMNPESKIHTESAAKKMASTRNIGAVTSVATSNGATYTLSANSDNVTSSSSPHVHWSRYTVIETSNLKSATHAATLIVSILLVIVAIPLIGWFCYKQHEKRRDEAYLDLWKSLVTNDCSSYMTPQIFMNSDYDDCSSNYSSEGRSPSFASDFTDEDVAAQLMGRAFSPDDDEEENSSDLMKDVIGSVSPRQLRKATETYDIRTDSEEEDSSSSGLDNYGGNTLVADEFSEPQSPEVRKISHSQCGGFVGEGVWNWQ